MAERSTELLDPVSDRTPEGRESWPLYGLLATLALMVLAMAVPALTGWKVYVRWFPPLHADWDPRLGWGTLAALALAGVFAVVAVDRATRLSWGRLLWTTFAAGLVWMLALAFVDGSDGIGVILDTDYEYLETARSTTDFGARLSEYVGRISFDAEPDNWPVHIAGHPPGALGFFVVLVRLGLGGGFAAGMTVTVVAATTAVAVLVTARTLGAETLARRAAPFLALGPAAIWQSVSADAMFAAVAAWAMAALAYAATRPGRVAMLAWSVVAGLLLGYCVMLSYGLALLGVLALTVLLLTRRWVVLPVAAIAAIVVVGAFWAGGFDYVDALGELQERYWAGVASSRPPLYWMWGNLAAFAFSAGPMVGAGVGALAAHGRPGRDELARSAPPAPATTIWALAVAGWAMVLLADASQMSRAEVERIWLPFVPWALLATALLPQRWRRGGLVIQLVTALAIQHLLDTGW